MSKVSILQAGGQGVIMAQWFADCATIDINACHTWNTPYDLPPSSVQSATAAAKQLREDGWVKTKTWGWLCGPCLRAYRTGNMSASEEDE